MASTNLYAAANQWATRPDDERFASVADLAAFCREEKALSLTSLPLPFKQLSAVADGGALRIQGATGATAALSHYAFGQLSSIAGAPAEFMRELPAELAATVINDRLANVARNVDKKDLRILFRRNGNMIARAMTSEVYDRVWNADVVDRAVLPLCREGFMVPPARPARPNQKGIRKATEADIIPGQENFGLAVKVGDAIAPAGLYASDRDLFVFLVDPRRGIDVGGRQTMRGIFIRNSEVGDGSLVFDWFDLDNVCGNHIVWGASNRNRVSVRHVGSSTLERALARYEIEAKQFDDAAREHEELIKKARKAVIAVTKEEVIDTVVKYAKTRSLGLSRKVIEAAAETAENYQDRFGEPRTVWAISSGITQNSQESVYANERHALDIAAGKLLEMAF